MKREKGIEFLFDTGYNEDKHQIYEDLCDLVNDQKYFALAIDVDDAPKELMKDNDINAIIAYCEQDFTYQEAKDALKNY